MRRQRATSTLLHTVHPTALPSDTTSTGREKSTRLVWFNAGHASFPLPPSNSEIGNARPDDTRELWKQVLPLTRCQADGTHPHPAPHRATTQSLSTTLQERAPAQRPGQEQGNQAPQICLQNGLIDT